MTGHGVFDVLMGLVIVVGLAGAVVQVIPGGLLVGGAVIVWGVVTGGALGWSVAVVAVLLTGVGAVLKYLLAGGYLKRRGIPNRSILVGAVLGVAGFFVIPVVGLFVGFIGGTYLAEHARQRDPRLAWQSTVHAMKATGLSILVELTTALITTVLWVGALVAHA